MHRVQVVEDDRRLRVARAERRRDRGRHRHEARHVLRRVLQHLAEARDGGKHARLALVNIASDDEWLVEANLQPVIAPDQPIELRIAVAKCTRVVLPFHQLHVLRHGAEREVATALVVPQQLRDSRILLREGHALVRPHVIDLAVEDVRPLEHGFGLGSDLRVRDFDGALLEW